MDIKTGRETVLAYYERCFAQHGDTAAGAGWPNEADRLLRFDTMLEIVDLIVPTGQVRVCDLGCGSGGLLGRIRDLGLSRIEYMGTDALDDPLASACAKYPGASFRKLDLMSADSMDVTGLSCDIAVANGLFTVKRELSHEAMWAFMAGVLSRMWPVVGRGIVFNVMSPVVDWTRDDLFHVSYDRLAILLHGLSGRSIGFRADYGLYEYTAYALKAPHAPCLPRLVAEHRPAHGER